MQKRQWSLACRQAGKKFCLFEFLYRELTLRYPKQKVHLYAPESISIKLALYFTLCFMKIPLLIIVERDDAMRRSLENYFKSSVGFNAFLVFNSLAQVKVEQLPGEKCLLLISVTNNEEDEINEICSWISKHKTMRVLLTSGELSTNQVLKLISSGISGILDKTASFNKISQSLTIIQSGGSVISPTLTRIVFNHLQPKSEAALNLTKRQTEVLQAMLSGLTYEAIGHKLNISINTVRKYVRQLYTTYQVNSRGELAAKCHNS
jgi:DNA-binding NarL/FixJ family response regulator